MPTLDDYEYQFGDGEFAVKLNKSNAVFPDPIWDVTKVTGLDMPPFRPIVADHDGQHGSDVYAKYLGPRSIVIDGILYTLTDEIDTQLDLMKDSIIDVVDAPSRQFYFKHPGIDQRYCEARCVGFNADVALGRRTGQTPYQLRLLCADPIVYIDEDDLTLDNMTGSQLINNGIVDTGIKVVFTDGTLSGTTTIRDNTNGVNLTFALSASGGDKIEVDTGKRRIQKNNGDVTAAVIADNWWLNKAHGEAQEIEVTWTGDADVKVIQRSGWW